MYTNKGNIQNYLAVDIDNSLDTQINTWITAAQSYIDNYTGRTFEQSSSETRYFDGDGKRELDIDEIISITSLEILEINSDDVQFTLTEGRGSDYILYPYNETFKYRVILTVNSQVAVWSEGKQRIKITGLWGNSVSVPKDIELVATMLVAGIIEKGMKGGSVQSETLGDYSVSFKDIDNISSVMGVKEILQRYKIWEL